jgi:hypothetical protein
MRNRLLPLSRTSFAVSCLQFAIIVSIILASPVSGQICGPCCEEPWTSGVQYAWPDYGRDVEVSISADFDLIADGRAAVCMVQPSTLEYSRLAGLSTAVLLSTILTKKMKDFCIDM